MQDYKHQKNMIDRTGKCVSKAQ